MPFLQKAILVNASTWLHLVNQDRTNLEHWMPYLRDIQTLEDAQDYIRLNECLDFYLGTHIYEIWAKESLVGLVMLHSGRYAQKAVEIAYWIGAEYRGNGYSVDACHLLIDHVFTEIKGIHHILLKCMDNNKASQAIAQKLGFQLHTHQDGILEYRMTPTIWQVKPDIDKNYISHSFASA